MADYTDEEIANANKISAWAAERDRQARETRRATYLASLRPIVASQPFVTLRADLRNLMATTPADDDNSFHVTSMLAAMDRLGSIA